MLRKEPKPSGIRSYIKGGIKTILLFEAGLLLTSYIAWQQLRSSRDSRLYCQRYLPFLLDKYYSFEEYATPTIQNRVLDREIWLKEGKLAQ